MDFVVYSVDAQWVMKYNYAAAIDGKAPEEADRIADWSAKYKWVPISLKCKNDQYVVFQERGVHTLFDFLNSAGGKIC